MTTAATLTARQRRQAAHATLTRVQAVAREFGPAGAELTVRARNLRADFDGLGMFAPAPTLCTLTEQLGADLAALEHDRRVNSDLLPPSVMAAVVVTLYGTQADGPNATSVAGTIAAQHLGAERRIALVDATPVATPSTVGTRYTFRQV